MSHLAPPPVHPSRRVSSASPSRTSSPRSLPPALPPRYDDINRSTPQLPRSMPGSVEDLGAPLDAEDSMDVPPPPEDLRNEEELSEIELREMYDSEEIDRFLHIFQTYVSEVKAVDISPSLRGKDVESRESSPPRPEEVLDSMIGSQTGPSSSSTQHTLSEWCAQQLIVWLPTEQQHFPELSLKQVHMTVERTYLALLPTYLSLFGRVIRLATWKDYSTSLVCCLLYWFLWAHGLLFPAACICLLYSLLRRRFLPYPTLAELRRRRHEVNQAEQFGAALSKRLAMSSSFQVKDAWYLFKEFRKTRKEAHGKETVSPDPETVTIDIEQPEEDEDFDSVLSAEELTLIQLALFFFSQLSDFHERARNLFLWRRPQASLAFAILLFSCAIISAMPAVYISRLCGLAVGLVFWHLSPVIAALPPSDRMRIIPPSWPVPTDAEYAMELISQRVARGLEVRPRKRRHSPFFSDPDIAQSLSLSHSDHGSSNWEKVGKHAAGAREYVGNVKETFKGDNWKNLNHWRSMNPLSTSSTVALPDRGVQPKLDARSYPAQHGKTTGLITLSPSELIFTSFVSLTPKLVINLKDIASVQKRGILDGLRLYRRQADENGVTEEIEEKFTWVGGRDDLFTRLVGSQGLRWINVR